MEIPAGSNPLELLHLTQELKVDLEYVWISSTSEEVLNERGRILLPELRKCLVRLILGVEPDVESEE